MDFHVKASGRIKVPVRNFLLSQKTHMGVKISYHSLPYG